MEPNRSTLQVHIPNLTDILDQYQKKSIESRQQAAEWFLAESESLRTSVFVNFSNTLTEIAGELFLYSKSGREDPISGFKNYPVDLIQTAIKAMEEKLLDAIKSGLELAANSDNSADAPQPLSTISTNVVQPKPIPANWYIQFDNCGKCIAYEQTAKDLLNEIDNLNDKLIKQAIEISNLRKQLKGKLNNGENCQADLKKEIVLTTVKNEYAKHEFEEACGCVECLQEKAAAAALTHSVTKRQVLLTTVKCECCKHEYDKDCGCDKCMAFKNAAAAFTLVNTNSVNSQIQVNDSVNVSDSNRLQEQIPQPTVIADNAFGCLDGLNDDSVNRANSSTMETNDENYLQNELTDEGSEYDFFDSDSSNMGQLNVDRLVDPIAVAILLGEIDEHNEPLASKPSSTAGNSKEQPILSNAGTLRGRKRSLPNEEQGTEKIGDSIDQSSEPMTDTEPLVEEPPPRWLTTMSPIKSKRPKVNSKPKRVVLDQSIDQLTDTEPNYDQCQPSTSRQSSVQGESVNEQSSSEVPPWVLLCPPMTNPKLPKAKHEPKRASFDLPTKKELIDKMDARFKEDKNISWRILGTELGVNLQTLRGIWKKRTGILKKLAKNPECTKTTLANRMDPIIVSMEAKLVKWYHEQRQNGIIPIKPEMCGLARQMVVNLRVQHGQQDRAEFLASPGWLHNFLIRHKLPRIPANEKQARKLYAQGEVGQLSSNKVDKPTTEDDEDTEIEDDDDTEIEDDTEC